LDGSQGGRALICEGVNEFSIEKVSSYTSCRYASSVCYFGAEVDEHLHGFHHRVAEGTWKGQYLCGDGKVDQICTLLFHSFKV
jgi:hypothetical protein